MAPSAESTRVDSPLANGHVANGSESSEAVSVEPRYTSFSTLADLPGHSTKLGENTTGEELGKLFAEQPDLPGVILFNEDAFVGVISQSHFYKCVSRAFGREIYYRRTATIMLSEIKEPTLVLPSDCPIYTAVEKCLTRPLDFVYEPFLVHHQDSGEYRLCAVQILLLAASELAALRNQQMELILNSVTDGLLIIDQNYRIGSEYSHIVEELFERDDLRDASLLDVLKPLIDSVTYEQIEEYLKVLFEPKMIDRLIKSINPAKQITARFTSRDGTPEEHTKHFALNFERIRTQSEISQILVQVEDITRQVNLSKELALQEVAAEEKLQLVMQILQVEAVALNRFNTNFNEGLESVEQTLSNPPNSENLLPAVHGMFRKIHTLKGEASLLRLTAHQRLLHLLEDDLDKLRQASPLETASLTTLSQPLEALNRLNEQIQQILDQVKSLDTSAKPSPEKQASTTAQAKPGLMESLSRLVTEISERVRKPAVFYTTVKDAELPQEHLKLLGEILPHLIRNSMVHGIEQPEVRQERGKNQLGIIQFDMRAHGDMYEMIFQDDGGGLDLDKIRQRAAKLGWQLPTEDHVRYAIFEPGFSTAHGVTDLAGRGVGLDAVRDSLIKAGGRIVPHSLPESYCAFQILLPRLSPPPPTP